MTKEKVSKRDGYGGEEKWNALLQYVKYEILNIPQETTLSKNVILRLDGLSKGQYISNNKVQPMAKYQYDDILETFKLAKVLMKQKNNFNDNNHKFNYAMVIVENKINDVVMARKKKQKVEEKIEYIDTEHLTNERAKYKANTEEENVIKNPLFAELW